ncbi:group I truncated hemoglobin [Pseudohongiella nitratireducens]|jgi:hemoglobin|nr:group 1 truncated hemoglobin [Pseudohongiella nitratireducens]MDF1622828.1 group 1 truncated hemoglobin [Pseudohongiella nitratireducens]|tara:strand:+ start:148 stop:561 length:414 start_codon:yes stop_codon:yes gene_type:complete
MRLLIVILLFGLTTACVTSSQSLYAELGGEDKVDEVVENFITEIEFDPMMYDYFKDSDIGRFREKFTEHFCMLTGGPCEYTGDTMEQVHTGMEISEANFNHAVDLLISAMNKANIPHRLQNRVLATMAPLRGSIIYI